MTIALLTAAGAQLDRFVIQILSTTDQVGLYASAQNIMNIVSYAMLALMSLLLPAVADYYAKRMEESRFVSRAKLVARGLTLLAAVVLVISVFGGEFLLRAFGPGFQAAHSALVILSIGQLVGAALGVGTTVLSMGDHRHTAVWITGLTVVVNLGLAFALVGPFGLEGAAVANASGLVFNRLAGHLVSRRRLGLSLTAF